MEGSGISANPWDATELSIAGFSIKTKSTASLAPVDCISAESMTCAVCAKSRSAVISGPRSESMATVRNSRLKFSCGAAKFASNEQTSGQIESTMQRNHCSRKACWLVWCGAHAYCGGEFAIRKAFGLCAVNCSLPAGLFRSSLSVRGCRACPRLLAKYPAATRLVSTTGDLSFQRRQ